MICVYAAANQSTVMTAVPVTADKLGHTLDSDDESLAEYMGQLSSHKRPDVPSTVVKVS